jgi:hypothetical protein
MATAFASGGGFSLQDLVNALGAFSGRLDETILGALDRGTRTIALRSAVTDFMQGLGTGKNAQPPNPPPGPLGIRTGNLRRDVQAVPATGGGTQFVVALSAGANVPYAAIHEFGGDAGKGGHAHIPARPYMLPALQKSQDEMLALVEHDVLELASSVLG